MGNNMALVKNYWGSHELLKQHIMVFVIDKTINIYCTLSSYFIIISYEIVNNLTCIQTIS